MSDYKFSVLELYKEYIQPNPTDEISKYYEEEVFNWLYGYMVNGFEENFLKMYNKLTTNGKQLFVDYLLTVERLCAVTDRWYSQDVIKKIFYLLLDIK